MSWSANCKIYGIRLKAYRNSWFRLLRAERWSRNDLKLIVIHDPPTDDNFAPLVEAVAHIMAIVFIGGNVWTRRTLGVCLPPRPR